MFILIFLSALSELDLNSLSTAFLRRSKNSVKWDQLGKACGIIGIHKWMNLSTNRVCPVLFSWKTVKLPHVNLFHIVTIHTALFHYNCLCFSSVSFHLFFCAFLHLYFAFIYHLPLQRVPWDKKNKQKTTAASKLVL